jgi:sulfur relay (sulfurtransferase) DsrF/TusC family protein
MKNYLIINRHSPISDLYTEEILELILSIASLENSISILLLEDAGLLLLNAQFKLIKRDLLDQTIAAFKLFNFENIYIENNMLEKFKTANLSILTEYNFKVFHWDQLNTLYNTHDIILNF